MNGTNLQIDILARLLDVAGQRHEVIAQNVANVNTPGYRRLEVQFEDSFADILERSGPKDALQLRPSVVEGKGDFERADGNNVDIDAEVGRLNKNTLLFKLYAQVLALQLASMRSAISGR